VSFEVHGIRVIRIKPIDAMTRLPFYRDSSGAPRGALRCLDRRRQILAGLCGAILVLISALSSRADKAPAIGSRVAGRHFVAHACGIKSLGSITVATLSSAPIVTLSANGHPVTLILDTGAERTILTPAVAERIGAQPPRVEFQRQMRGITGTLAIREVELHSFTAGGVAIPWRRVWVAPITMAKVLSAPIDGLLGADALSDFDIDLDLPRHRMAFYDKQSCPDGTPEWAGGNTGISTGRSPSGHLFFPVQLDGHRIVAIIDTGAQLSTLSLATARALGVTQATLSRDRSMITHGAAGEQLNSHVHQFARLEVGTEIIRDPELVVVDVKLRDADIVLGFDFLSSRRLWLSYESLRLFLSSH
jgi:predicted aspartyl protease